MRKKTNKLISKNKKIRKDRSRVRVTGNSNSKKKAFNPCKSDAVKP